MSGYYQDIKTKTDEGKLQEALCKIDEALQKTPADPYLLYLKGNVYMKSGSWGEAISMFRRAELIDPQGPAREARLMLDDIMNFYNKDMFNQ